ncbi:hypothetical protein MB46_06600 [Arthrobacter alpinus]|nr:hypothetical protein MB46_06600 [Arthrobacter alpinus]
MPNISCSQLCLASARRIQEFQWVVLVTRKRPASQMKDHEPETLFQILGSVSLQFTGTVVG